MKKTEAKELGLESYVPDKPCKRGHWERRTSSGDCIECVEYRDNAQKDNLEKYLLKCKKANAKYIGVEFNLTIDDIVIPEKCPVLGIPLFIGDSRGGSDNSPSIDRVDSSKGYIKGNVKIISNKANRLKSDMTVEQVKMLLKYMEESI